MARSPSAPGRKSSGGSGTETDPYLTAGPEDEFEPDWGAGRGTAGQESLPRHEVEPADRGTTELQHGRVHGARSGIDIGGVLMRIGGDVRNL